MIKNQWDFPLNQSIKVTSSGEFPVIQGDSVVKTSPSNAGDAGWIPAWEVRSDMVATKKPKQKTTVLQQTE